MLNFAHHNLVHTFSMSLPVLIALILCILILMFSIRGEG